MRTYKRMYIRAYIRATETIVFNRGVHMYFRVTATVIFDQYYVTNHNFITTDIIGVGY